MTVTWESHPGEEQLHVVAPTPEGVVAEAVAAFTALVAREPGGQHAQRTVEVEADDHAGLLVELFGELIYLAETQGFVADDAVVALGEGTLRAILDGRLTTVDPLVKGATYHGLSFTRCGRSWDARIVLDV